MNLKQIFDQDLVDFLDRYSDTQESVGTKLLHIINKLDKSEVIIPVLGMQGMGKSTLINGLLEENILPNDADETTCVPVEVKYGTNHCAKIHFFDREDIITVHSREELNEYVNNNNNPANVKHVAYIELFRTIPMLKEGMVIVDLPGVGSLTKENETTTKRYVENLCSAIFVIPTVPTIRNREALFIKSLWSQFSRAIFVQNDWGETKEEISESMDFNNKVLRKIGEELHNPYDNEIILVNAYKAISGALRKDETMVEKSNIKVLYDKIMQLSTNWESEKDKVLVARIKMCIECAKAIISRKLADIGKSKERIDSENDEKISSFEQGTIELSDKINELKSYLRTQEDEIYFVAKRKSKECTKSIRAAIYRVIDDGVYDGEYLSTAFNDIQEEEIKDFTNSLIEIFINIKFEVEKKIEEINQLELKNEISIYPEAFQSDSSFKWEKGLQFAAKVGGAFVGTLGASAATAAIYSALGISAASGPVGWVVVGVGLAIYGLFSLFGWGVKKMAQSHRADNAKRQISSHIDEIERKLMKIIPEKYNEFSASCQQEMDAILRRREDKLKVLKTSLANVVEDAQQESLKSDLDYISNKQNEFESI